MRKIASVGLAPVGAATGSYLQDHRDSDWQNILALRFGLAPAGATIRCFRRGKPETEIDGILFATEKFVSIPNF